MLCNDQRSIRQEVTDVPGFEACDAKPAFLQRAEVVTTTVLHKYGRTPLRSSQYANVFKTTALRRQSR